MEDRLWAILLDLDQTLVLTSALAHLRRQRQWQQVYRSFSLTTLPPQTHWFLQEAGQLAPLGIITTSPRPYAEQLVAYHCCPVPVVVAYHDTPRQKPFPDPLLIAARKLHVPVTRCFYIGDAPDDVAAATNAGARPIVLCWDGSLDPSVLPASCLLCTSWPQVLDVIKHTIFA